MARYWNVKYEESWKDQSATIDPLVDIRNILCTTSSVVSLYLLLKHTLLKCFSYNSAIFQVIRATNDNNFRFIQYKSPLYYKLNTTQNWNLTNSEWPQIYGAKYIAEHGDLYLVADQFRLQFNTNSKPYSIPDWSLQIPILQSVAQMSGATPNVLKPWSNSDGWVDINITSYDFNLSNSSTLSINVLYAFALKIPGGSSVQISLYFMIVVIICNILKATAMVMTYFDPSPDLLVTLGDAIASFLETPDPATKGVCTLSREELLVKFNARTKRPLQDYELEDFKTRLAGIWQIRYMRYISALSKSRQFLGLLL